MTKIGGLNLIEAWNQFDFANYSQAVIDYNKTEFNLERYSNDFKAFRPSGDSKDKLQQMYKKGWRHYGSSPDITLFWRHGYILKRINRHRRISRIIARKINT